MSGIRVFGSFGEPPKMVAYKSRAIVSALQISAVEDHNGGTTRISFVGAEEKMIIFGKKDPWLLPGSYYVNFADGHVEFIGSDIFERSYEIATMSDTEPCNHDCTWIMRPNEKYRCSRCCIVMSDEAVVGRVSVK